MKLPKPARTKELLAMGKEKLRRGIDLLTGHMPLRAYLFNLGLTEQKEYRLCGEEGEDNLHLLCRCPALACKRYKSWGHMFMTPMDLENAKVSSLINLINNTRLGLTE
ncbi:hypothetical protein ALC62_11553 [Cyphomyrmex costatus]|uniref:Uncharacterized protein n=1 Tax=Cyphomyrmex costatus TaxID=456900 RepID=A0A151ICE5_9HYME|nr:hypothetical protein ALC62_11553 [Cyphomyrmex costatus]